MRLLTIGAAALLFAAPSSAKPQLPQSSRLTCLDFHKLSAARKGISISIRMSRSNPVSLSLGWSLYPCSRTNVGETQREKGAS